MLAGLKYPPISRVWLKGFGSHDVKIDGTDQSSIDYTNLVRMFEDSSVPESSEMSRLDAVH